MLLIEIFLLLVKTKPALVVAYTVKPAIYASIVCGMCRRPCVAVLTGLGSGFIGGGVVRKIMEALYRLSLRFAARIVFLNESDRSEFFRTGLAEPSKCIVVSGEGVDTDYYQPRDAISMSHWKETLRIGYIGRLLRDKGLLELGKAVQEFSVDEMELCLVGTIDSNNPSSLSEAEYQEIASLTNVTTFGFVEDVRDVIAGCDFIILPSYREGLSMALLEAMSMGRPILASDIPGCRELVIDGENGYTFRARSVEALIKVIRKAILLERDEIKRMGQKSRTMIEDHFSSAIIIKTMEHIFDECIYERIK